MVISMSEEIINTDIERLEIKLNKVVSDRRGALCEVLPDGSDGINYKIRNVHASIAVQKGIPRAGHYHNKNIEIFYTLTGSALWIFMDYRKSSPTFGKIWSAILGFDGMKINGICSYTIDNSQMAQVLVPAGVYHVFYPLTEKLVTVLSIASETYDEKDYVRINPEDIMEIKDILDKVRNIL